MAQSADNLPNQPFKRPRIDHALETGQLCSPILFTAARPRPRLMPITAKTRPINPYSINASSSSAGSSAAASSSEPEVQLPRPPTLVNMDDYLTVVGNMYYTSVETGRANKDWAVLRRTTFGMLTNSVRTPNVWDKWAPLEIAKFESAICMTGKQFHVIAKMIGTKTTAEVIEFYYLWKQSKNYGLWKRTFKEIDKLPDA